VGLSGRPRRFCWRRSATNRAYACHVQDGSIHTLLPQHVPIDVDLLGILA